ncbi:SDR family NAD(P)-dependent oxidoreductase [Chloroflexota bacterium]
MSLPVFSLDGQVALVTGGKRGIGKAIALAFTEAGADVAICSREIEDGELKNVANEIKKLGRRSLAVQADTSVKADVDNLVEKVMEQFGAIDILVNNAGINIKAPILSMSEADWDKIIDIDLKGYFLCAQAVGRIMVEQKRGNIINIASQHAFKYSSPGMGAYAIAKAGVVMLTRVLARELSGYGIRANGIAPGLAKTELSRGGWGKPEVLEQIEASLPLGRIAEPVDFIGAALFLASEASSYLTGQTIIMEGGGLI